MSAPQRLENDVFEQIRNRVRGLLPLLLYGEHAELPAGEASLIEGDAQSGDRSTLHHRFRDHRQSEAPFHELQEQIDVVQLECRRSLQPLVQEDLIDEPAQPPPRRDVDERLVCDGSDRLPTSAWSAASTTTMGEETTGTTSSPASFRP